jgi:serine/threonine protein kinase
MPLSRADAVRLLREAAHALAALHARGWVHRDVKPANLLLRADGSLALGDFGTACPSGTESVKPAGTVTGTPRYAAPEQFQGAAAHASADVYSLGIVLCEMLCGHVPYAGETATELLAQHLLAPVPQLAPAHADLQPLVHAMLAKNPRDRLPDAQAVLAGLGNRS